MRILIVEDDSKAAAHLSQGLSEAGYEVDVASDGEAALAIAQDREYGLIVCDVMMPGENGFATISRLRQLGRDTAVIFVTAVDDVAAKVHGLDLGGDDYLVKPFAFAELLARVRALVRRAPSESALKSLTVGDLELDFRTHSVRRRGKTIELAPKEFSLLVVLAEGLGEVIPRQRIAEKVWGMDFDSGTNIIDVQIKRLRTKIDPLGMPTLIQTVRGIGYRLEPDPNCL